MKQKVTYLTAETAAGRVAIMEVMTNSYHQDLDDGLREWSIVRVVDGAPVSFIIIDPNRSFDFHAGRMRYAFVNDVATREDRRNEGHFRRIMEYALYNV